MLRQRGFTLTELLIGSTLGLIVLAGALQLYQSNVMATNANLRLTRLNYEARAILNLIATEVRRTGYWAGTPGRDPVMDNPFMRTAFDLHLGHHPKEAGNTCVLYSYDRYADKQVGVGSASIQTPMTTRTNMELFGFRLSRQRIQMRNGGRHYDCGSGSWQTLTGADTRVSRLEFSLQSDCLNIARLGQNCQQGQPAQLIRTLNIKLAAHAASDPNTAIRLNTRIHLPNDRMIRHW